MGLLLSILFDYTIVTMAQPYPQIYDSVPIPTQFTCTLSYDHVYIALNSVPNLKSYLDCTEIIVSDLVNCYVSVRNSHYCKLRDYFVLRSISNEFIIICKLYLIMLYNNDFEGKLFTNSTGNLLIARVVSVVFQL